MNRLLKKISLTALILSVTFLFSNPLLADPPNLTLLKKELKNYHDSGLYQEEFSQVIEKARNYIKQQAEINQKRKKHKKLAIVLDIDETSISNYNIMIQRDFGGNREQFHKDVIAANSPAIESTLALYKDSLRHGIKVFFVTGRNASERRATEENLTKVGYSHWSELYLRPNNYSSKSIIPFKAHARKQITEKGYTIVASIGDQYSDLKGGYAKKIFKVPNPFYYLP